MGKFADAKEETPDCSSCDSGRTVSPDCFPIPVPPGDPVFSSSPCLHFARSLVGQLKLGYREQQNQLTSYIDASNVYGSDVCAAGRLRSFQGGELAVQGSENGLLPANPEDSECRSSGSHLCFHAGDERVNEHAGLGSLHTLGMREHNKYARKLAVLNPHWSDERLYQEGRKIVSAIFQHITYKEWLPKVLGFDLMEQFDLQPLSSGYYEGYDDNCDAGISNVFATSAFRFGHTLVQGRLMMMSPGSGKMVGNEALTDLFFNVSLLYDPDKLSSVVMGLCRQPAAAFDATLDTTIRNHLFEVPGQPGSGLDLAALNIQRGRDHGLPPYVQYREALGLSPVRSWADLQPIMDPQIIGPLQQVYASVEDVDIFTGTMSERRLSGAVVGPTLGALLAEQFQRLRKCDRFWYENGGEAGSFTPEQLSELRKQSLSSLLCRTMEGGKQHDAVHVQPDAFRILDGYMSSPVSCSQLPEMDLGPWKDRSGRICLRHFFLFSLR